MLRRQWFALAPTALLAACASVDQISFDRGAFAISFEQLAVTGLTLLNRAIAVNTKAGAPNAYATQLTAFRDELQKVKSDVERQILEAPGKSRDLNTAGLNDIASILTKAIPVILPLIAAL